MSPIKVFLDVDTGVDDALALLLAARSPELEIKGVTCVSGNVPVDLVVRNTLAIMQAADQGHVPVARGMDVPLLERMVNAAEIHGENGLGGVDVPDSSEKAIAQHAVEFLWNEVSRSADPITIIALAPLTNIATLIRSYPAVIPKIERLVVMGGAVGPGNVTPTTEFNIRQDPEAADIVISSDIPVLMYTWDVFVKVAFSRPEIEALAASSNKCTSLAGELLASMLDRFGRERTSIGDAGAVACLLNPAALTTKELPIAVELSGTFTRGQTVVDQRPPDLISLEEGGLQMPLPSTVELVVDVDVNSFRDIFTDNLAREVL